MPLASSPRDGGRRFAVDTLFTSSRRRGSLIDFLRNFLRHAPVQAADDTFVVLVSRDNRQLYEDLAGPRVVMVDAGHDNDAPLRRILDQQLRLPGVLRRERCDAFFAAADVAPLGSPVPVVLKVNTFHHEFEPWALGRARAHYRRIMIARSARRAAFVVANSQDTATNIRRFLHVPDTRLRLVYEAIDDRFGRVEDPDAARAAAAARFGLPDTGYFLFLSTLYPYKNADVVIDAAAVLRQRGGAPLSLVIAGPDSDGELARLRARVSALGLEDSVRFLGGVPNAAVPELLGGAIALLYPSLRETFGKPLVEAMQLGVPVLGSAAGAIPEVLGGAGMILPPSDASAWAAGMERVRHDPAERAAMVARGLERASFFSWPRAAGELVALLRLAAAGANR